MKNPGETVKSYLSPQDGEFNSFTIHTTKYANNEIKLSENKARKIVEAFAKEDGKRKFEGIKVANMKVSVEIVIPNYTFEKLIVNGYTQRYLPETRRAYVFTYGDIFPFRIYVDCTTGEILGGDEVIGFTY